MTTLDPGAVDALLARARRDVEEGLLPACQLALALDGEVLVQEAFGAADVDTRFTIFSSTEPFVASLIWQLLTNGRDLHLLREHRRPTALASLAAVCVD